VPIKSQTTTYSLYATPLLSYPSQLTLVKLIKLKRTQSVCTEKERNRERKREKTERKDSFFPIFFSKNLTPHRQKKMKNKKKKPWHPGDRAPQPCHPGARVPI
jgi:hypothetical protein